MPDPDRERLTGKSGYIRLTDNLQNQFGVPIISWDAEMTTIFQDVTGSMNFSKDDGIIYRASAPVARYMTAEIKGCYRRSNTPTNVIAKLFNGNDVFRVELGFSPTDPFADFYAWAENFQTTNPILGVVVFTCSLRSEGTISDLTNLGAGPLGPGLPPDD